MNKARRPKAGGRTMAAIKTTLAMTATASTRSNSSVDQAAVSLHPDRGRGPPLLGAPRRRPQLAAGHGPRYGTGWPDGTSVPGDERTVMSGGRRIGRSATVRA